MRFTPAKAIAASVCSVALLGAVGCSSNDTSSDTNSGDSTNAGTTPGDASSSSDSPSADDASATLVGKGCATYAKAVPSGSGSVSGMAQDPVATAASNNPLLTTLTATVSGAYNKKVDLVDTLNGDEFTVFAPVDDAFKALPKATLAALAEPKNGPLLSQILTYHVVPGQIAPADIAGKQTSVEGKDVTVTGTGDNLKVNGANVICGGVQTSNATVYLIDAVLTPPDLPAM
ncbi:MAG: fasciclin domain-containing protein [Propionibacteriales bacterium]|nr:fasciclin domain-containing protein [Propionibacteriales bacterium]